MTESDVSELILTCKMKLGDVMMALVYKVHIQGGNHHSHITIPT